MVPSRAGAERAAINAPMQGTAADLIKLSMVAVQDALDAQGKSTLMIMQVHDELVFQVPEAELRLGQDRGAALDGLGGTTCACRLLAEVGEGLNWEAAH
jgi:DNA polymerase-1